MKKILILVLALVFVLAGVTAAYANPDSWNSAGPTYRDPVSGDSPHGTYATTGDECEICHSPHQAGNDGLGNFAGTPGTSWKLLRSSGAADACDYCHAVDGAAGSPYIVYVVGGADVKDGLNGHEIAAYTNVPDTTDATNETVDAAVGESLDCFDCHSVHGAATLGAAAFGTSANGLAAADLPTNAILKEDPGNTLSGPAANINEYCDSCHTDNLQTATNGTSHYMGAVDAIGSTRGAIALAAADSSNCISCHTSDGLANDYVWPHNSTGEGLMSWESATDVPVTRDTMDANCLGCHDGIIGDTY